MTELYIKENEEGKKLSKYLKGYLVEVSDGFIYKMLRKKNILLNDKKATGFETIKSGDKISIFFKDETIEKLTKGSSDKYEDLIKVDASDIDIIYEDDDMMIIDKPIGVLSQKTKSEDVSINEIALKHMIDNGELDSEKYKTYKPSIVNRIDMNTMGLIIFAKNYKASVDLSSKIKNREIEKYYIALVNGIVKNDKEKIIAYLSKDENVNKVNVIGEEYYNKLCDNNDNTNVGYEKIETEYEVIERRKDTTLLKIKLITGRSHQIRAHLSYIGHPIVGDKKYMVSDMYKMNVERYKKTTQCLVSKTLVINGKTYQSRYEL